MSLRKTNPIWPTRGARRNLHTKIKIYFNIYQNLLFGIKCYQMVQRVQIYEKTNGKSGVLNFTLTVNGKIHCEEGDSNSNMLLPLTIIIIVVWQKS